MEFFHSDPFTYIVSTYLSGKYLISLYHADLITEYELYTLICNNIEKKLQSIFSTEYKKFREFMIKYNIKISGSFVLENILGEEYDGDIDFYINENEFPLAETIKNPDFREISNISWSDCPPYTREKTIVETEFISFGKFLSRSVEYPGITREDSNKLGIKSIINIEFPHNKYRNHSYVENDEYIQILEDDEKCVKSKIISLIYIDDSLENHIKKYDFSIVKNIFSYNSIERKFILQIENLDNIFNKQYTVNMDSVKISVDRIKKYEKRGFKINANVSETAKILQLFIPSKHVFVRYESKNGDVSVVDSNGNIVAETICTERTLKSKKVRTEKKLELKEDLHKKFNILDGISIPCDKKLCYLLKYLNKTEHMHIINRHTLDIELNNGTLKNVINGYGNRRYPTFTMYDSDVLIFTDD